MNNPERDLARPVVEHFRGLGIVFPEVSCWTSGDRADAVILRADASLDVLEVKRAPSARLERQARQWLDHVERVWVAYEPPRRGAVTQRWLERFRALGIGVLHVIGAAVEVKVEPVERVPVRDFRRRIVAVLSPLHETFAEAGNANSEFLSAYRLTCHRLRAAALACPGITMRAAVESIPHHYASNKTARSALLAWIRAGKVPGVKVRIENGAAHLYADALRP